MDYLHAFGNVYLCKIKSIECCTSYRNKVVRQNNLREFKITIRTVAIEHPRTYLVIRQFIMLSDLIPICFIMPSNRISRVSSAYRSLLQVY